MKYSEAEKQIKALSNNYRIYMNDGDFNVAYTKNDPIAYVKDKECYKVNILYTEEFLQKLPFSSKLYMILAALAVTPPEDRKEEKKQYVKIYDSIVGYLNIDILNHKMSIDSRTNIDTMKTKFTNKDIEELKKRDDIPLDWNKVHFEDAE